METRILMKTSQGDITIALNAEKAPITVKNFLDYVDSGYFSGTVFHRVIPNFMIQGGGYTEALADKPSNAAIKNEADNGLANNRGSIAMARTSDPESATSQFFINLSDNDFLNFTGRTPSKWGYCVFGEVVGGMDTVDKIAALPTGRKGVFSSDVPDPIVIIESVTRL